MPEFIQITIVWTVTGLSLFLPGWFMSQLFQTTDRLLSAFVYSCLLLFLITFVLGLLNIPLNLLSIGGCLGVITFLLGWKVGFSKVKTELICLAHTTRTFSSLLKNPCIISLLFVFVFLFNFLPAGPDNIFRWEYLAREIFRVKSFEFYPPVSNEDYQHYFWPDGIPPLISFIYCWIYTLASKANPFLLSIFIYIQTVMLFTVVQRFSSNLFNKDAGIYSVALLGSSALIIWILLIGQETGMLTIAFLTMLYAINLWQRNNRMPDLYFAAAAGALGALCREYGWILLIIGAFNLYLTQKRIRPVLQFSVCFGLIAGPWYLRSLVISGNPFLSLNFFGLFKSNTLLEIFLEVNADWLGFASAKTSYVFESIFALSYIPLIAGSLGLVWLKSNCKTQLTYLLISFILTALWYYAASKTAGFTYSLRILAMPIALFCIMGGGYLSKTIQSGRRVRNLTMIALFFANGLACIYAWALPLLAHRSISFDIYSKAPRSTTNPYNDAHITQIIDFMQSRPGILFCNNPALCSILKQSNKVAVSIYWEPRFSFLFDNSLTAEKQFERLKRMGFHTFLFPKNNLDIKFMETSQFFQNLKDFTQIAINNKDYVLLIAK